jgi:hypothetical protein
MVLACYSLDGVQVGHSRGGTSNEVICPGELPVGLSTLLLRRPCSLSAAHWGPGVKHPCTSPLPLPRGPPPKVQRAVR